MEGRKLLILQAIVDEYIKTGEPVGSKTIAKLPQINVSPATVRNEMAMLEQLGYLEQPHTSAGRIPTFKSYRLYIDNLVPNDGLSDEEMCMLDAMLGEGADTEEGLIQSATKALAELTQCAAVVANVSPKYSVITKVEVVPTGRRLYVILLITSNGCIKNKACRMEFDLTDEQLSFFSEFMRDNLQGTSVENLSDEIMEKLVLALGTYMMTLSPLVQGVYELSKDLLEEEIHITGERNLLTCKEFEKSDIIQFMEQKNQLSQLLDDSFSGIQVMFSEEQSEFVIGNSSMIVSQYKKGDKMAGSLGVIGPMRLNYSKIIPYIEYFSQRITDLITDDENDE